MCFKTIIHDLESQVLRNQSVYLSLNYREKHSKSKYEEVRQKSEDILAARLVTRILIRLEMKYGSLIEKTCSLSCRSTFF
jgi:hypothetical protein